MRVKMPNDIDKWNQFDIRIYNDAAAGDARRVEFHFRGRKALPAIVVMRARGELIVRYLPPEPAILGLTRDDFVLKAAEMVKSP